MKYHYVHLAFALAAVGSLGGCGSSSPSTSPSAIPDVKRTCESIRKDVISIAAGNGVNIVKIYDPKVLKNEPKQISCSGRALVSSGQEATIYYRDSQDAEGDWLVQYDEKPLD